MTQSPPTLSIVMPAFNPTQARLGRSLGALRDLPVTAEVIIVDDGSAEPVAEQHAALLPPNARVIRLPENTGAFVARRIGAEQAKGRFIHFIDADDEVLPKIYSHLTAPADTLPDVLAFRTLTEQAGEKTQRGKPDTSHSLPTRMDRIREFLLFRYLFGLWNKIYRRDTVIRAYQTIGDSPRIDRGEDFFLQFFLMWEADSFRYVEEEGYLYCPNDGSVSRGTGPEAFRQRAKDQQNAFGIIRTFITDQPPSAERTEALRHLALRQFTAITGAYRNVLQPKDLEDLQSLAPEIEPYFLEYLPWVEDRMKSAAEIARLRAMTTTLREMLERQKAKG
ncbi:glycosyltransferase family 2 protein [Alphaproteobacteria bacterium KMM 3653]|uniref:Glycosyltransferase family 2 protein n=1 Tax=Harenicola maris TaxID=2841044 RepID=A0AAP2CNM1_9RHOB|nr:glycosyltransferase family 2 protein [Harenicola maris]